MDGLLQPESRCTNVVHPGPAGREHTTMEPLHRAAAPPVWVASALQPLGDQGWRPTRIKVSSMQGRHGLGDLWSLIPVM